MGIPGRFFFNTLPVAVRVLLSGVIFLPILISNISVQQYGTFITISSIYLILTPMTAAPSAQCIHGLVRASQFDPWRFVPIIFLTRLLFAVLCFTVGASLIGNAEIFLWSAFGYIIGVFWELAAPLAIIKKNDRVYIIGDSVCTLMGVGTATLISFYLPTYAALISGMVVGNVLQAMLSIVFLVRGYPIGKSIKLESSCSKTWLIALWNLLPSNLGEFLYGLMERSVLLTVADKDTLGLYAIYILIRNNLCIPIRVLKNIFTPDLTIFKLCDDQRMYGTISRRVLRNYFILLYPYLISCVVVILAYPLYMRTISIFTQEIFVYLNLCLVGLPAILVLTYVRTILFQVLTNLGMVSQEFKSKALNVFILALPFAGVLVYEFKLFGVIIGQIILNFLFVVSLLRMLKDHIPASKSILLILPTLAATIPLGFAAVFDPTAVDYLGLTLLVFVLALLLIIIVTRRIER